MGACRHGAPFAPLPAQPQTSHQRVSSCLQRRRIANKGAVQSKAAPAVNAVADKAGGALKGYNLGAPLRPPAQTNGSHTEAPGRRPEPAPSTPAGSRGRWQDDLAKSMAQHAREQRPGPPGRPGMEGGQRPSWQRGQAPGVAPAAATRTPAPTAKPAGNGEARAAAASSDARQVGPRAPTPEPEPRQSVKGAQPPRSGPVGRNRTAARQAPSRETTPGAMLGRCRRPRGVRVLVKPGCSMGCSGGRA